MPEIIIKNQSIERFVEEVASAYCSAYPSKAEAFDRLVRHQTASLIKTTGMSTGGTLMEIGALPNEIYAAVKHLAKIHLNIPDFWDDFDRFNLFLRVWSNCRIKRTPTPFLTVPALRS
jgi:hypothetical protein